MDGARPHDHQRAVIGSVQDAMDGVPRFVRGFGGFVREGEFAQQVRRRNEFLDLQHTNVISPVMHNI